MDVIRYRGAKVSNPLKTYSAIYVLHFYVSSALSWPRLQYLGAATFCGLAIERKTLLAPVHIPYIMAMA